MSKRRLSTWTTWAREGGCCKIVGSCSKLPSTRLYIIFFHAINQSHHSKKAPQFFSGLFFISGIYHLLIPPHPLASPKCICTNEGCPIDPLLLPETRCYQTKEGWLGTCVCIVASSLVSYHLSPNKSARQQTRTWMDWAEHTEQRLISHKYSFPPHTCSRRRNHSSSFRSLAYCLSCWKSSKVGVCR
jgi:hypothetical protein